MIVKVRIAFVIRKEENYGHKIGSIQSGKRKHPTA
jgi:hypothetical protein